MMNQAFTTALTLLLLPSMASAAFRVNVCFTLDGGPVVDALVKCWDSDYDWDDRVGPSGGARTDANGCVSLRDNQWWWERPDIYCAIEPNGDCFAETTTATKNDHRTNRDANLGTLELDYDSDYCGDWDIADNGCGGEDFPSWLRDVATEVSGFENQCASHDTCYTNCVKSRAECDDDFYDDMIATCAGQDNCELLAWFYYTAVDVGGGLFYDCP